MLVTFYNDPVDVQSVCTDLNNGAILVVQTVRENFRAIADLVKQSIDSPYSGEVEDSSLCWHYYLAMLDEKYDIKQTDRFVLEAVKKWETKGRPFPFSAYV